MTADSASPPTTSPQPRRRWLQFSLRTLLLVMLMCAGVAMWLGIELKQGRQRRETIEWVQDMGGTVTFDEEATRSNWRCRLFGQQYPGMVKSIQLFECEVSDLSPLGNLPEIKILQLLDTQVSDLTPLRNLQGLQTFTSSLSPLKNLSSLGELDQLEWLVLADMRSTDLSPLANAKQLRHLAIESTPVTDLSPLAAIETLKTLHITDTQVSDLSPLTEIETLEWLLISESPVSSEQVRALEEALPDCTVAEPDKLPGFGDWFSF